MSRDTPLRVLFDDHGFRMKHGGVARYFCELFRHFQNVEVMLPFRETTCYYLQQPPWKMIPPRHDYEALIKRWFFGQRVLGVWTIFMFLTKRFPRIFNSTDYENDRQFCRSVSQRDYDVVHLTEAHCYGDYWKSIPENVPLVVTIHDLIPELIWHRDDIRAARGEILARADKIISVSHFTKEKLLEEFSIPEEKVVVVHHGYSVGKGESVVTEFVGKQYLLFVGKRDGYKRFEFFIRAVAPMLQVRTDLYVVCTGDPFSKDERRLLKSLSLLNKVCSRFATDGELRWLYRNARIFVFPSLMEGFGLPILEAFSARCPVVLPKSSCFPEIAGDAALYFSPEDADDLCNKVASLLDDEQTREEFTAKGVDRLRLFSWTDCAEQTERVYSSVSCRTLRLVSFA